MEDSINSDPEPFLDCTPPPSEVFDGAHACIQYVEKKLGIGLDYQVETLPILDHYLREAKRESKATETTELIASVSGCYFGEVLRRRYPLSWNTEPEDQLHWSLSHPSISIFPTAITRVAIEGAASECHIEVLRIAPKLSDELSRRLRLLPPASEQEYIALSTRVEVIDIAFDLIAYGSLRAGQTADHDHVCGDDCITR